MIHRDSAVLYNSDDLDCSAGEQLGIIQAEEEFAQTSFQESKAVKVEVVAAAPSAIVA